MQLVVVQTVCWSFREFLLLLLGHLPTISSHEEERTSLRRTVQQFLADTSSLKSMLREGLLNVAADEDEQTHTFLSQSR